MPDPNLDPRDSESVIARALIPAILAETNRGTAHGFSKDDDGSLIFTTVNRERYKIEVYAFEIGDE